MAMMISKFHKIIQSKLVWIIFLGVIVIAFVFAYMPGMSGRRESKAEIRKGRMAGSLFGEDVTRQEFAMAYKNVYLPYHMYFLQMGSTPPNTSEFSDYIYESTWQHLALLRKAQQLGITTSQEEAVLAMREDPWFQGEDGQFNRQIYDMMMQNIFARMGFNDGMIASYYADKATIGKLSMLPAQGALVPNSEIQKTFHLLNDENIVEYATVPRSMVDSAEVTDQMTTNYYEAHGDEFRTPEKVLVDYVEYPVKDFMELAQTDVTDELVAQFYENNKQRYLNEPVDGEETTNAPAYTPFEDVKEEITETITKIFARKLAADKADELVSELSDESAVFEDVAKKLELTVITDTPAFSALEYVEGVDQSAPFQQVAMALSDDGMHDYSDPVEGNDSVYVIKLNKRLESFLPALEEVKTAVVEAAQIDADEKAYLKKATDLHAEIKKAISEGATFTDAAKKLKLAVSKTEAFSTQSTIEDKYGRDIQAATVFNKQGDLCELITTTDEPVIAYVAEKISADEATKLVEERSQLANRLDSNKSALLVSAWRESILKEANLEDIIEQTKEEAEDNS